MMALAGRAIRKCVRIIGGINLLRLLLLFLTLLSVGFGLISIVAHLLSVWLPATILVALLAGWLAGRARLPGWASALGLGGLGLVWLGLTIGQMSAPLGLILQTLPGLLKQTILHLPDSSGPFLAAWTVFIQSLLDLVERIMLWFHAAGAGIHLIDPSVTTLIWALAAWLVSAWAAWWLRRREALSLALLPATLLLAWNVYYTNSRIGLHWLIFAGGGWVLLQALESYIKACRRWEARQMDRAEIEPALASLTILLAAGLMLAGGLLPSISIRSISDSFQHVFQGQSNKPLAEALGLQQTPVISEWKDTSGPVLSYYHMIGPGPQLSQEIQMYVSVEGYRPTSPVELAPYTKASAPDVTYYWRAQTYDTYSGHAWLITPARTQEMAASAPYQPASASLPPDDRLIVQHVQRLQPLDGALFAAGDLLSANQPASVTWRSGDDLIYARTEANAYTADSRLPYVSASQLRSAGRNYPAAIQNYLALPDELPDRVRDLAIRLTIGQPTPYDQVMAIQNYLRQFPYSLQVPGAPADRDAADYFLFSLKKGYCDYFATTMAVMARAAGIPARLVTGFSSGRYDYQNNRFVVVQADAHAWVEVYFPGTGWVEFEPTSNLPEIARPGQAAFAPTPASTSQAPAPAHPSGGNPINWRALRPSLAVLEWCLAILGILLLAWRFNPLDSWLLHWQPAEKAIPAILQRLYRAGRAWGVAARASRTPHEFARAFSACLER
ncbi:MAG TPA: transglutaminase-like domain-containing protein, partial [Anaerolineales bacterium]|nr:transglutaminase-like domain-containing protein [Anaerolineales bacterium]